MSVRINYLIDELIAAREAITNRTEEYINIAAVDHIDNVLRSAIPQGRRDDVDRLLGRSVADYSRENFQRTVIDVRMQETPDNPWQLSRTIRAANEARATMSGAALDLARAANQGDIDDALEAEHDAKEDHRHLMSGD